MIHAKIYNESSTYQNSCTSLPEPPREINKPNKPKGEAKILENPPISIRADSQRGIDQKANYLPNAFFSIMPVLYQIGPTNMLITNVIQKRKEASIYYSTVVCTMHYPACVLKFSAPISLTRTSTVHLRRIIESRRAVCEVSRQPRYCTVTKSSSLAHSTPYQYPFFSSTSTRARETVPAKYSSQLVSYKPVLCY